jgi:hypothetical protein
MDVTMWACGGDDDRGDMKGGDGEGGDPGRTKKKTKRELYQDAVLAARGSQPSHKPRTINLAIRDTLSH